MKTRHLIGAVCGTIFKVIFTVVVAMLIYKGAILAYDYGYRVFMEPAVSIGEGRTVPVTITEGMSPAEMGELLASKGLIRDGRLFAVQYLLSEYREDVSAGEYELSTAMTVEEMLQIMAKPKEETENSDGNSRPGENLGSDNVGDESAGENANATSQEGGEE